MDTFIIYLAKASGLVALFYAAYYLLLKKETFFTPNRWFLLAGLVTSALLPLVEYTKVVWVAARPSVPLSPADMQMLMQYAATVKQQQPQITVTDMLLAVYCVGALLFFARFVTDVSFIRETIKANKAVKQGKFRLIDSPQVDSPFSFFTYIVYNSATLQPHELESILAHEKVHSRQRHSADMIFGQLFCVIFWFNPFVWLYKKAIAQNLEFIADAGATNQVPDVVAYQKTLLKITMQPKCIAITNHFYQSLIKKRIIMLNKEKSKASRSFKYVLVLPALAAFMLAFQVKVIAQEKPGDVAITKQNITIVQEISKDTDDSELEESKKLFKQEFDADVTISDVARNNESEITAITVRVGLKDQEKKYQVKGTQPIETFKIVLERNDSGTINATVGTTASVAQHTTALAMPEDTIIGDTIMYTKTHRLIKPMPAAAGYAVPSQSGNVALNFGNSDALVVINGIKYAKGQEIRLPAGQQVTGITTLDAKEGKAKYGKEGKKGVVEINTAAAAYGFAMPNPIEFSYDMNIDTDGHDIAFSWDNITKSDLDFAMKHLDGIKAQLMNDDMLNADLRERARIILDDIFIKEGSENEALKAAGFIQLEKSRAELEEQKEKMEKKRTEKEKERAETQKKRDEAKKKAELDKKKAKEKQ